MDTAFLILFVVLYLAGVGAAAWSRYDLTARFPRRRSRH
jgi:hypothetical protein